MPDDGMCWHCGKPLEVCRAELNPLYRADEMPEPTPEQVDELAKFMTPETERAVAEFYDSHCSVCSRPLRECPCGPDDEDPEELAREFDAALAAGEQVCITAPPYERDFMELSASGILWAINRMIFHPRGYALTLIRDTDGNATGWYLQGDGKEPWKYQPDAGEDESFRQFEHTLYMQALPAAQKRMQDEEEAYWAAFTDHEGRKHHHG